MTEHTAGEGQSLADRNTTSEADFVPATYRNHLPPLKGDAAVITGYAVIAAHRLPISYTNPEEPVFNEKEVV